MSQLVKLLIPGSDQRFEIDLNQNGSDQELILLFIGRGKEEYCLDTLTHHKKGGTRSLTTVRGVLLDQAKATVNGLIKIEKDAQKTEAFLEEKILLIGNKAQAQVLPQLEIEADDVKASHAATVGRLNEEELFYLQSRGLTNEEAQSMIIKGFFASTLTRIKDTAVKKNLEKLIESQMTNF